MTNIIARHGSSRSARRERGPAVAIVSGHYDTLDKPGFEGANDGAATGAALVELCSLLQGQQQGFETWLVLFDGEESFEGWSAADHTYGSRQLASEWARDGTLERVGALINIDMIADKKLGFVFETASTPWLRSRVWGIAHSLGYLREFPEVNAGFVADDHLEFLKYGVAALELVDFDYGFMNRFWHTDKDRVDKLSARSIAVTLHVLVETLASMDAEGFEPAR
jgi:glutaminyl-peptide cyclotransferase